MWNLEAELHKIANRKSDYPTKERGNITSPNKGNCNIKSPKTIANYNSGLKRKEIAKSDHPTKKQRRNKNLLVSVARKSEMAFVFNGISRSPKPPLMLHIVTNFTKSD